MIDANANDALDPAATPGIFMIQLERACRSYLVEVSPTNKAGPDAAESWESSPDAREWRFKLAKGQAFHSGKDLTSSDVVASLNYHRGPNSKSGGKGLLLDVEDAVADGKDVVVVKTRIGTADLPYLLADYHLPYCRPMAKVRWVGHQESVPGLTGSIRSS